MAFTDTLEWTECKATVGLLVCTVYTDGQQYKPCVLCETGFKDRVPFGLCHFLVIAHVIFSMQYQYLGTILHLPYTNQRKVVNHC